MAHYEIVRFQADSISESERSGLILTLKYLHKKQPEKAMQFLRMFDEGEKSITDAILADRVYQKPTDDRSPGDQVAYSENGYSICVSIPTASGLPGACYLTAILEYTHQETKSIEPQIVIG